VSQPTAYRVFYRNKRQEVVLGEQQLQQRLARKTPAVLHHEVAHIHTCAACGVQGPWVEGWAVPITVWNPEARKQDCTVACSDLCARVLRPDWNRPTWAGSNDEPWQAIPEALNRARHASYRAEERRKRDLRAHRSVPMFHEGKGDGWCRWCGTPVPKPRRTWHEDCLQHYLQHTDLNAQYSHLAKTRGRRCAAEGCTCTGAEVDHVVPLWKVRDLPDRERRPYYGPANLQLLCHDHHKAKTAREAGERAAIERGDMQLEYGPPGHGKPTAT
jgi:hypothetical protein